MILSFICAPKLDHFFVSKVPEKTRNNNAMINDATKVTKTNKGTENED